MRYLSCLILLIGISAVLPTTAAGTNVPLAITITCSESSVCTYKGGRYFRVDVTIRNESQRDVLLTTRHMMKAGPDVTFTDVKSRRSIAAYARLSQTNHLGEYEIIPPNGTISFSEAVSGSDILAFGNEMIDIDVELTFDAKWKYADGQSSLLREPGRFKIVGADTASRRSKDSYK